MAGGALIVATLAVTAVLTTLHSTARGRCSQAQQSKAQGVPDYRNRAQAHGRRGHDGT
jgi:hypothetical protein